MYGRFEHTADVGIFGNGHSLEEAFNEIAKAMFNVEVDITKVKPKKDIVIDLDANDLESLLFAWLNELLAQSDINNMIFSEFDTTIKQDKKTKQYHLSALCKGEKKDEAKMDFVVEVKAATYNQLEIKQETEKKGKILFTARCVVDV